MNTHPSHTRPVTGISFKNRLAAFAFVGVMGVAVLGAGFIAGISVRLELLRGPEGVTATAASSFAGFVFHSKTVSPVVTVVVGDATRDRRNDSQQEKERRRRQQHVSMRAPDRSSLNWDREDDYAVIDGFLRAREQSLVLRDEPPLWRLVLAGCAALLGTLICAGAVKQLFLSNPSPANNQS